MPEYSANFAFLSPQDETLAKIGSLAESYFVDDPSTCLIKLRQFAELLAKEVAASIGLDYRFYPTQHELLQALQDRGILVDEIAQGFQQIRKIGNRATHENKGSHDDALSMLKIARELGMWFYKSFRDADLKFGPFTPPKDPKQASEALRSELERLRQALDASRTQEERARAQAKAAAEAALSATERMRKEQSERQEWEQLALEIEHEKNQLEAELQALQAKMQSQQNSEQLAKLIKRARAAAEQLQMDEATTRNLIDQQLREAGWEADSMQLRYSQGTRPEVDRQLAIAEWPTASGKVDYALFIGLTCVGVVEAKRQNQHAPSALAQAERYARDIELEPENLAPGGPWYDAQGRQYRVPFAYATNGRPYLQQYELASGIWFKDLRQPNEPGRALAAWHRPKALHDRLQQDLQAAQERLANQPIAFAFPLRPYQQRAIEAVEAALANQQRNILLAMATGSGKTKLAIAMLYRLLESKRFQSVCFVVDRSALGEQAYGEFSTTQVVTAKRFAEIFEIKGLKDTAPSNDTKIHICTIQSLVRRVLNEASEERPPIDQYDLLVIDECHRGYLLDRELSDSELSFRDQNDYISKYRRVLDYFDAVKIGLTATPALHTEQIFGPPVFTYSYREAVLDGYLVDQEPTILFRTELAAAGIHFQKDEEVELIDPATGSLAKTKLPDELSFEVEEFNRKVITRSFNEVIARELAKYIDINQPGKTLVFAVNNEHADLLVDVLYKAFDEAQGPIPYGAIAKITGAVDQVQSLIRSYRNDEFPKIAVTVDLLTTGVDVPKICHLVFMRRVNSRILYEQMIGRATRRCDQIGKQSYFVYDAVDLYRHMESVTDMRPVAQNPNIPLSELFMELSVVTEPEQLKTARDQLVARLRRMVGRMNEQQIADYSQQVGESPKTTIDELLHQPIEQSIAKLHAKPQIISFFTGLSYSMSGREKIISHHPDAIKETIVDYHGERRPEDYLEKFNEFVRSNLNKIAALELVVTRPRALDRKTLRELQQILEANRFSERTLQKAWAATSNAEIAASIIGYVRQAALGDPLIPYAERVHRAVQKIMASHPWTPVQRSWLERIERQIVSHVVPDVEILDEEPFKGDGGRKRIEKVLGRDVQELLSEIAELIWNKEVA